MKKLSSLLLFFALSACKLSTEIATPGVRTVTTLAGSRNSGSLVGLAGIAVDPSGAVFVSKRESHVILRITPDGVVSTFAGGSGQSGHLNGQGNAARFSFPTGLASDSAGNIYVADTGNSVIRKITPVGTVTSLCAAPANDIAVTGVNTFVVSLGHAVFQISDTCDVTLLAGSRVESGLINDTGPNARFNGPWGLAVDRTGTILVADSGNNSIRKITPQGVVSTLVGGNSARLNSPFGVALDSAGTVFIADSGNHTIRQIQTDGRVLTIAGTPGVFGNNDGVGPNALFKDPVGLAVNRADTLFVNDYGNHAIRKLK